MPRTPQAPSLKSKSHKYGGKDLRTVACRLKMMTRKITKVMIQIMETRLSTRKTPFFRLTSPEKMINRIFNPNSPPNDLSSSKYPQKMTLELWNSNFSPPRWLFNPAITVGKNCAFNLHFAMNCQNPQTEPNAAATSPQKSSPSNLPAPLPAAPEHLAASELEMAPKKAEIEGKKKEAQPSTTEWTHSKCSLNHLKNLVSEGLQQEKNLVNWRPSYREPFPMENVDEIVTFLHFAERGLALLWQNQPDLYRLKYASSLPRAPTCFKRYNPLACRVTSR
jgi:hypothetical protein